MKAKGVGQVFELPSSAPAPLVRGEYVGAGRFAPLLTRGRESDCDTHKIAPLERGGRADPTGLREGFDSDVERLK